MIRDRMKLFAVALALAAASSFGVSSVAFAALTETYPAEGGVFRYGTEGSGSGKTAIAHYWHRTKTHRATACDGSAYEVNVAYECTRVVKTAGNWAKAHHIVGVSKRIAHSYYAVL